MDWYWSGTMTVPPLVTPTAWVLSAGSNSINPTDRETEEYPRWYDNVQNYHWSPALPQ